MANEAEIYVFLEFPCVVYDSKIVGNLISGSSAFLRFTLNILKFSEHTLLRPSLKDFEHNLTSMGNEHICLIV